MLILDKSAKMTDFRHAHCPLIGSGVASDQFIFEVNFNHFAHQAVGCAANGGDLLQNRDARLAAFQRARSSASTCPRIRRTRVSARFLSSGECGIKPPAYYRGVYYMRDGFAVNIRFYVGIVECHKVFIGDFIRAYTSAPCIATVSNARER